MELAENKANVLMSIFWKSGNAVTFVIALGGRIDPEATSDSLLSWQVTGSGKKKDVLRCACKRLNYQPFF